MSKWIKFCTLLIVGWMSFQLAGCTSASATETVEKATNTPQVLSSEAALATALKELDTSDSYTVSITKVISDRVMNVVDPSNTTSPSTKTEDSQVSATLKCLVDNKTQAAEINSSNSTGDYSRVYTSGRWYVLDATQLLKPSDAADWSAIATYCTPMKNELDVNLLALPSGNYTYTGEDTINDQKVYAYSITLPDSALDEAKKALSSDSLTYSDLTLTDPQFTLYLNEETGQIIRLKIEIAKMYTKYSWKEDAAGNYTEFTNTGVAQLADFSAWNSTNVDTSQIVDAKNTDTQQYSGKYSNYLTFSFAKVDRLVDSSSDSFYISLRDLMGSSLSIIEQPTWYFTNDGMCSNYANTVYLQFLQASDSTATIESANLVTVNGLNICKIVGISENTATVQYLFTEPDDVAKAQQHTLNSTYNISITPAAGEDPRTLFSDVVQSLKFVGSTSN